MVDLIIRERRDSKQTWIEFRLLAQLISGQIGTESLKNEFEIFLSDMNAPFIANIAKVCKLFLFKNLAMSVISLQLTNFLATLIQGSH